MRLLRVLSVAALALTIGSTAVRASTVQFTGNTAGCFGSSCAAQHSATDHTLRFTGTNLFDVSLTSPANLVGVTLGGFSLTNSGIFNPYVYSGDQFNLQVNFTSPLSGTTDIIADVTGFITVLGGLAYIDFNPQTVTYAGGSFLLSVNDVLLGTTIFDRRDTDPLTGSITMSSAVPEPSTWAIMILGFVGLGFLANRRRQVRNVVAAA